MVVDDAFGKFSFPHRRQLFDFTVKLYPIVLSETRGEFWLTRKVPIKDSSDAFGRYFLLGARN